MNIDKPLTNSLIRAYRELLKINEQSISETFTELQKNFINEATYLFESTRLTNENIFQSKDKYLYLNIMKNVVKAKIEAKEYKDSLLQNEILYFQKEDL